MIMRVYKDSSYDLSEVYLSAKNDIPFDELVQQFGVAEDEAMADLIECDARYRLEHGKKVLLARYLTAIPGLAEKPVAFDAAIEFALRSIQDSGTPVHDAVARLVQHYPDHADAIYKSAVIGELLPSTNSTRQYLLCEDELKLPMLIGPKSPRNGFRYELRQIIGFGAHGTVYLAVDRELSSPSHPAFVAIKILGKHVSEVVDRERLDDEAMRTRRVTHPNVIHVLDQGNYEGRQYFVYEYVDGGDLGSMLRRAGGNLEPRQAAKLMVKICYGVQSVHAAAIVHLDLKPTNIMMVHDMEPKIADFGVARCLWENRSALNREKTESPMGTIVYMAPECYQGENGAVTTMADVYSLGVILIELITGKRPVGRGRGSVQAQSEQRHAHSLTEILESMHGSVDPDLRAICERAVLASPHERFTSAEAMARSLEDWLGHRPLEWKHPLLLRRAALLVQRRPAVCALSFLLVIAMMGAVGGVFHTSALARERILKERVSIQEDAIRQVQTALQSLHLTLNSHEGSLGLQWMPTLMALEELSAPLMEEPRVSLENFSDARIHAVESLISDATAHGFETDSDVLMWETLLGYWLIIGGNPAQALDVLEKNQIAWEAKLGSADAWIQVVKGLKACAIINLSTGLPPQSEESELSEAGIQDARRQLLDSLGVFQGHREGTGIHKLMIESLSKK